MVTKFPGADTSAPHIPSPSSPGSPPDPLLLTPKTTSHRESCRMWRRWSSSSTETKPAVAKETPAPPPTTPAAGPAPKLATSSTTAPVKQAQHDLSSVKPVGAGQRRRSSILEKLARETTKEGISATVPSLPPLFFSRRALLTCH